MKNLPTLVMLAGFVLLASLANGVPHALHLVDPGLRLSYAPPCAPMRTVKLFATVIGVNCWYILLYGL